MPTMTIRVTNAVFESVSTGDFDSVDEAFRASLVAGLEIGAAEIVAGAPGTIVEVGVNLPDTGNVARGAVAIVTTRFLHPSTPPSAPQ